jgi:hypothetical protein
MDRAASLAGTIKVAEMGRGEHGALTRTRMMLSLRGGGPRFTGGEEEEEDFPEQVRLTCLAVRTMAGNTFEMVVAGLLHDPVRPPSEGSHLSSWLATAPCTATAPHDRRHCIPIECRVAIPHFARGRPGTATPWSRQIQGRRRGSAGGCRFCRCCCRGRRRRSIVGSDPDEQDAGKGQDVNPVCRRGHQHVAVPPAPPSTPRAAPVCCAATAVWQIPSVP